MSTRIIGFQEVHQKTGQSRSSITRREKQGLFPQRRRLGPKSIGWLESEVNDYIASLPKGFAGAPTKRWG